MKFKESIKNGLGFTFGMSLAMFTIRLMGKFAEKASNKKHEDENKTEESNN